MSKLHFLHSGGDKVTLTTPASNPSTNPIFKLPQTDGGAGQFLKTDGSGALSFATALTNSHFKNFGKTTISSSCSCSTCIKQKKNQ